MEIHVYAIFWNEARMLPYFFRHYDAIADRYFLYDDGSTDGSRALVEANPKTEVRPFPANPDSFLMAQMTLSASCWKASRGQANWVLLCDIDEQFYHPQGLRNYLQECSDLGYSLIIPEGYEMVAKSFPATAGPLCKAVRHGVRLPAMDKPQLFDPNAIKEITFGPGRHTAKIHGRVLAPPKKDVKLLHYKYLGLDYLLPRQAELGARHGKVDRQQRWGVHYEQSDAQKTAEFERLLKAAAQVC